jgi:hypothetical protein
MSSILLYALFDEPSRYRSFFRASSLAEQTKTSENL